jgi:hypothetical protein
MKLAGRDVRFSLPFLPGSRWVRLAGQRNSVQLMETALVVEGNILKLHMLGLERFLIASMSEWTTITVPYSRIRRVELRRYMWLRLLFAALIVANVILFFVAAAKDSMEVGSVAIFLFFTLIALSIVMTVGRMTNGGSIWLLLLVFFCAPLLILWLPFIISSQYRIEYGTIDNRRRMIAFQIRSKKKRVEFDQKLRRNWDLASSLHRTAATTTVPAA